ncbi:MAG: threonine/serine exporter family protein [Planctomycetota bacterium]
MLNPSESEERSPPNDLHAFIIQVGVLLQRFGTPSHRLEAVLVHLGKTLGVKSAFLYTPTALIASFTDDCGEATYVRRVESGPVDVDKLIRFDETLEGVEAGNLSVADAREAMERIAESPSPFPAWAYTLACGACCASVCVFFRGGVSEVVAAFILGIVVAGLEWLLSYRLFDRGLLEPLAGFVAAVGALAVSQFCVAIDDRIVTLASLIVLVPGLTLTVALTELAVGHLSAGVARIAGAGVSLMTMSIGAALGWRLAGAWREIPEESFWPLPEWSIWPAIAVAPLCFAIVFRARWRQWPVIYIVTILGFSASYFVGAKWGIESGAFAGALVVALGSNCYARLRNRPALVPLTPGILVLVPGSLGYRSMTAFIQNETLAGVDAASAMLIVAAALVGGILTANIFLPPKRIL